MAVNTTKNVWASSSVIITETCKWFSIANMWTAGTVWLRIWETWSAVVWEWIPLVAAESAGKVWGSFSILDSSLMQAGISAISSAWSNAVAIWYT